MLEKESPFLSVVIPAYNEENRIEATLRSVDAYLSRQLYSYEIIVVDDGSRDGTYPLVERLSHEIKGLRLISYPDNRGKGWAVKRGMLEAKGRIRLFMDADNSTTIDQVERMLPYFEKGAEIVIGSRRVKGAVIAIHQPWLRENLGRAFNVVARLLSGLPMKDTQAGFKAFTAEAAERIFPLQTISRWSFDVELLVIGRKLGFRVEEVPIVWKNDERSHVSISSMASVLKDLVRIRLNALRGAYKSSP
ncbi:MAG: glycosyltransferase family 2 protein [Candidatus Caldarchaeum sp.]